MKKIGIILSAFVLTVCSCSKELPAGLLTTDTGNGTVSFTATFERSGDPDTRLGINTSSGILTWTDGDAIAVQMTDDTFVSFTYSPSTQKFTAFLGGKAVKDGGVAYYPASIAIGGTPGSVNLPASYAARVSEGVATVCPPMTATVNLGASSLSLTHLGGILSVKASYVPADATKLVLTATGKDVTGNFTVSGGAITAGSAGSSNTVTLTFSAGDFGTSATEFFIPVPVTTFTGGFSFAFKNASDETLFTHSTKKTGISVARANIKRMAQVTVPKYIYVCANPSSWSASSDLNWSNVYVHAYTASKYNGKNTFYSWKDSQTLLTGSTFTHDSKSYYRIEVPADFGSATDVKLFFHDGTDDDFNRYNYSTDFSTDRDTFFTLSENTTGPYKLYFVNQTSSTSGTDDANVKSDSDIYVYVWDVTKNEPISPITNWDTKKNLSSLTYENLHDSMWIPFFEVPKGTNLGLIFIGKDQTSDLTSYDSNVSKKHVFYLKKLYKDGCHEIVHVSRQSVQVAKD